MSKRRPAKLVVSRVDQLKALSGPLAHRLMAAFERLGRCSVGELAEAVGEEPESLYYHVRRLAKVGLINVHSTRPVGRQRETVYEMPGRELKFDHRQTSRPFLEALGKAISAVLRMADRAFHAALMSGEGRRVGGQRNLLAQQHFTRLSPAKMKQLNRMIEDIGNFVKDHDDPRFEAWLSLTMVMAPVKKDR